MIKRITATLFFILINGLLFAQTTETIVRDIRSKYKTIRENLSSYEERVEEIMNESTEGGHATAYLDGTEIKLIEIALYGEMGKQVSAYYFDQDELFFAFTQIFHYNVPFYMDKERAEEMGLKEFFDPKKTKVEEHRYYFADEMLFRYLDKDKKEVDVSIKSNKMLGESLLEHAKEMKAIFEEE